MINGIDRFEERSSLRTWMFRILVNRAKTRGQRDGRTRPFSSLTDGLEDDEAPSTLTASCTTVDGPGSGAHHPRRSTSRTPACSCPSSATDLLPQFRHCPRPSEQCSSFETCRFSAAEVCELLDVSEVNQRVLLHRLSKACAARGLSGRTGGGQLMRQPEIRCVEFVESRHRLDGRCALRRRPVGGRGAPRDLSAPHRVPRAAAADCVRAGGAAGEGGAVTWRTRRPARRLPPPHPGHRSLVAVPSGSGRSRIREAPRPEERLGTSAPS